MPLKDKSAVWDNFAQVVRVHEELEFVRSPGQAHASAARIMSAHRHLGLLVIWNVVWIIINKLYSWLWHGP